MAEQAYSTITRQQLERRFIEENPDNQDPKLGYALVNVSKPDTFQQEHIPGSINIPQSEEFVFVNRFAKFKEIIVYCASTDCHASESVAEQLSKRGFTSVYDYTAGLRDWKQAGNPVTTGERAQ